MFKKDEMFQAVRWINLIIGVYYIWSYIIGANPIFLGLGAINTAIWAFTRRKPNE